LFNTIEPKPGIPPSPKYISELAESMKKSGVKVVVYQPYYNADASKQVAQRAGGEAIEVPTECGGVPGTDDVFAKFDAMVTSIAAALAGKTGGRP
jgi:ABC-type Zn uptake system ZnuABC Zn-binding protein ZnuA